jgi:hypothetical protein
MFHETRFLHARRRMNMIGKAMAFTFAVASCFGTAQAQAREKARAQAPVQAGQSGRAVGPLATVGRADVKVWETVLDLSGRAVGVVKKVTAKGAIISTGSNRAEVPFAGIRRSNSGLVTSVTKAQIDRVERGPQVPTAHDAMDMPSM